MDSVSDTAAVLDRLFALIDSRRDADPAVSYTAKLFARGPAQCAKKLGEEAIEAAIAAVERDKAGVIAESADLLYHLLVLWAASGVRPEEVLEELVRREGVSGIVEKNRRWT